MLVFEHIPKTAGTTFIECLEAAFPAEERFIVSNEPGEYERDFERLMRMPKSERRKLRVVAGHFLEMFRLVEPEARYISIVRDPIQRVISEYRHFLDDPNTNPWARKQFGDHISLQDYAYHASEPNRLAKILLSANYEGLTDAEIKKRLHERFHVIGLTEDFISFVMYLHLTEDMPLCLFNDKNVRRHHHTVELKKADIEAIQQRNSLDIRLYEIIRDDFSARYGRLMTPEIQALAERYRERLNVYRERTRLYPPDKPPSAVALKKTPESWAAKDDYQAIFQTLPPSWPEASLLVSLPEWASEKYLKRGRTLQRNGSSWQFKTNEQSYSVCLVIPLMLPSFPSEQRPTIKIAVQVEQGRLGIYVSDLDHKAMLTREVEVQPSSDVVEVRLDLPAQFNAGILCIRNLYSSCSQAIIRSIDVIDQGLPSTATEFASIQTTEPEEQQESSHHAAPIWKLKPINNAAVWVKQGAIALETPAQQWAYGAMVRFPLPGIDKAEQVVKVRLKVETGIMGLGWVNEDNSAWIIRTSAKPAPEFQDVSLVIPAGTEGGALIFDNWTEGGLPARALIQGIWIAS